MRTLMRVGSEPDHPLPQLLFQESPLDPHQPLSGHIQLGLSLELCRSQNLWRSLLPTTTIGTRFLGTPATYPAPNLHHGLRLSPFHNHLSSLTHWFLLHPRRAAVETLCVFAAAIRYGKPIQMAYKRRSETTTSGRPGQGYSPEPIESRKQDSTAGETSTS